MFKLFNSLRRSSIFSKRFGNYLLYALGEIVLVVIGILIALQINNWNNLEKLEAKERAYLSDILIDLEHDLNNLNEYIKFNEMKVAMLDSSIILLASDTNAIDAAGIMTKRMGELTYYRFFYPARTSFDNMVNAENIGLISSKDLRVHLSEYYDDKALTNTTQERAKSMTRTFTDYMGPLILNNESLAGFFDGDFHLTEPGEIDLRGDPDLISIMFSCRMATEGQTWDFKAAEQRNIELKEMINKFLQSQ